MGASLGSHREDLRRPLLGSGRQNRKAIIIKYAQTLQPSRGLLPREKTLSELLEHPRWGKSTFLSYVRGAETT